MEYDSLVSVIVPIYGTEKYLPRCIDSIIRQSYSNIEIILIDDQSPDSCPEICDGYAENDARVVVIHQENKGVSGARNAGLRRASGEYITFVDSDDELLPDAITILLQDAKRHDADIVSALYTIIERDAGVSSDCGNGEVTVYRDDSSLLLSLRGYVQTSVGKLFKTSFINGVSFEEGKNNSEDAFFMFQLLLRQPLYVQHNTAIYSYYMREGSLTHQQFNDSFLSILYFFEKRKAMVLSVYPQLVHEVNNMDVREHLQILDALCNTTDKKYKQLEKECIAAVKKQIKHHKPINAHHKQLAWIVNMGLYPLYKLAVRFKYYR